MQTPSQPSSRGFSPQPTLSRRGNNSNFLNKASLLLERVFPLSARLCQPSVQKPTSRTKNRAIAVCGVSSNVLQRTDFFSFSDCNDCVDPTDKSCRVTLAGRLRNYVKTFKGSLIINVFELSTPKLE